MCLPSILSLVMGVILRDKPLSLVSLQTEGLLSTWWVQERYQGTEWAEREIDRERGKDRSRKNTGQTEKKNPTTTKTKQSNLEVSQYQNKGDSVGKVK